MTFSLLDRALGAPSLLKRSVAAVTAILCLAVGTVVAEPAPAPAAAVTGSDFNPGLIITDDLFFDSNAMSQAEIQGFLDSKIGSCSNTLCLNVLRTDTFSRAAYFSTSSNRYECQAYAGAAGELASAIIYKVQQACGISAKVILVTLQKEQSLVTSTGPTYGILERAMGYGCPDSTNGACDSLFYGFYNQVYAAAKQFKLYRANPGYFNFTGGRTANILYNPNESCGSKSVYIQNDATAALYNYTPYTPNAGALANLYGTAPCGSYGNRNFWTFYTNWFGSTLAGGGESALTAGFTAAGGTAALGALTSSPTCAASASRCSRVYENGTLFWEAGFGAYVVKGVMLTAYLAAGAQSGVLGNPASSTVYTYPENGGGSAQDFGYDGSIFASAAGAFPVHGQVRRAYFDAGGAVGSLGWPIAAETCGLLGGGCAQVFQNGTVHASSSGKGVVQGVIGAAWTQLGGGNGPVGYPISAVFSYSQNGGGTAQDFQKDASIFSSPAGAFAIFGSLRRAYFDAGGATGSLGWPIAAQACGTAAQGCAQQFQNGSVYVSPSSKGTVTGAINTAWQGNGGITGPLGYPASIVYTYPQNGGGTAQDFQNDASIFSSSAGAYAVSGKLRRAYFNTGGSTGPLGWPIAPAVCGLADNGCSQDFQNGTVFASTSASGAVSGAIGVAWQNTGGVSGPLGYPASIVYTYPQNGGGTAQDFQKDASIFSSSAGAYAVSGKLRRAYFNTGGSTGPLGWPIAAQVCGLADNGCSQQFQNGTVFSSTSASGAVFGAIGTAWQASGGVAGPLGYPASIVYTYPQNGGGTAQDFQNDASIFSSSAGAYAVSGKLRRAYFDAGGSTGRYGWPTANPVCVSGTTQCTQTFQNGTITVP